MKKYKESHNEQQEEEENEEVERKFRKRLLKHLKKNSNKLVMQMAEDEADNDSLLSILEKLKSSEDSPAVDKSSITIKLNLEC